MASFFWFTYNLAFYSIFGGLSVNNSSTRATANEAKTAALAFIIFSINRILIKLKI